MISARGLLVRLDGVEVIRDVDLDVAGGEIVGLIGPPEAGKTVLLKAIAGLLPLAAGEVHWGAERVDPLTGAEQIRWQRRIGMAFQQDALFDAMTVFDNVAFPLRRRRLPEAAIAERVGQRLAEVGLAAARDAFPAEISGGMRKRVGIARAMVIEPELALFDDPVAGLDPVTGGRILDLIVELTAARQVATVVISNDLAVLFPICSRVVMLNAGQVVYNGDADGLVTSDRPEVVQFATGADEGPL